MNKKQLLGILIVILSVITVGIVAYLILNTEIKTVSLEQVFVLKKGQSAQITNPEVFLTLKDLVYSPECKVTECFWSGDMAVFELKFNGKAYASTVGSLSQAPFRVQVVDTDYKTFAKFVINEWSISCWEQNSDNEKDSCFLGLAERYIDQTYCDKIKNLVIKGNCINQFSNSGNK